MDTKENILNSWILMEQLSEGDVNTKRGDKNAANKFDPTKAKAHGYYGYFRWMINRKFKDSLTKKSANPGLIFYIDTFKFQRVIDIIVQKYHLKNLQDEVNNKQTKFGFSIAFDKNLHLLEDQTFVTMSDYLLNKRELINDPDKFKKFEDQIKDDLNELFDFQEQDLGEKDFESHFNEAFAKLVKKYQIGKETSYWSIVNKIDSDDVNLHSFFIDDLNWAKKEKSAHLDRYLHGLDPAQRINLDPTENIAAFDKILQPKNYPMGHFLSKFPASLMQQVAINLALNDKNDIRTVNGPPGTGKTTSLKDIFAELLVRQAKEICGLDKKNVYSRKDSEIGQTKLPDQIADKNIVVASSNNGAVQNIVDELPQIPDEEDTFKEPVEELMNIHYFDDIANANLEKPKYWGLFSLEGGRKENMNNIINKIKQMIEYLQDEDFQSDPDAYDDFMKQYNLVKTRREKLQDYANFLGKLQKWREKVKKYKITTRANGEIIFSKLTLDLQEITAEITAKQEEYQEIVSLIKLTRLRDRLFNREKIIEYKRNNEKLEQLKHELEEKNCKKHELEEKINQLQEESYVYVQMTNNRNSKKISTPNYQRDFSNRDVYDHFEEETYWYNSDDLREESKLFVLALRVRKQFLYENSKSLKMAVFNWNNQDKKVKENQRELTLASWQWINFAIPIISTTFASFHRMFKNLPADSVANLFIDEAGQAVPQAVVGPLLRSKKVMAVGDPAQIKPVNTLDSKVISLIGDRIFKVSEKYVSGDASVQTIMDQASQYGYYKDKEHENWIGIPLWVHRRCLNPMFNISNVISYNNKMVLPSNVKAKEKKSSISEKRQGKIGAGNWIDVKGVSKDKFVEKQAEVLKDSIQKIVKEHDNSFTMDDIFVITPFKNVAHRLSIELKDIGFTKYENGKPSNIGTVHTFQGKENKVVFLVLGASDKEKGAASWAVSEPNIINVAATRAKIWFFIIGDKKLYQSIGSETISKTIKAIDDYNRRVDSKNK